MSLIFGVFHAVVEWVLMDIPGGLGRRLRGIYYAKRLRHMGRGVVIDVGVRILNPRSVSIGDNSWIDNYAVILAGAPVAARGVVTRKPNPRFLHSEGEVVIGRNTHVAMFVVLQGHGGVQIGDDCAIASGSMLYSMSHHYKNPGDSDDMRLYKFSSMSPPEDQSVIISPVVVSNDCAVGLNCVLLPGAVLEEGAWLGANSSTSKPLPPYSICSGSPAVVTGERRRGASDR